jgi:hypothetical protein
MKACAACGRSFEAQRRHARWPLQGSGVAQKADKKSQCATLAHALAILWRLTRPPWSATPREQGASARRLGPLYPRFS